MHRDWYHVQDFIHFNSEGEFDLVYSRVALPDARKQVYGEHGFPFYSGVYVRVSEGIFDSVSDYRCVRLENLIVFNRKSWASDTLPSLSLNL
jgi:hypothetical protein